MESQEVLRNREMEDVEELEQLAKEIRVESKRHATQVRELLETSKPFRKRNATQRGKASKHRLNHDGEDTWQSEYQTSLETKSNNELRNRYIGNVDALREANESQAFFLKAALDLMTAKLEAEAQALDVIRAKFMDTPACEEVILSGFLRKSRRAHQHSTGKVVIVSPGLITYGPASIVGAASLPDVLANSSGPSLAMFTKPNREKEDLHLKRVSLPPGSRCKPIDKKSGKWGFQIIVSGNSLEASSPVSSRSTGIPDHNDTHENCRIWVANSEEERMKWMNAIESAAELGSYCYTSLFRQGTKMTKTSYSELNDIILRAKGCETDEEYAAMLFETFGLYEALPDMTRKSVSSDHKSDELKSSCVGKNSCSNCELVFGVNKVDIPLEWVHEKMGLPRGGFCEDSSTEQLLRDMQRDTVCINGVTFSGWATSHPASTINSSSGEHAGPGMCAIVYGLAKEIQRESRHIQLTEMEALSLSHQVLTSCNRTQSGGSTLDAMHLVLSNELFAMIVADSDDVQPLRITVYTPPRNGGPSPSQSPSSSAYDNMRVPSPASYDSRGHLQCEPSPLLNIEDSSFKRKGHRKTASEGEMISNHINLLDLGSSPGSMGNGSVCSPRGDSEVAHSLDGSPPPPKVSILRRLSKIRHRRRASEPNFGEPDIKLLSEFVSGTRSAYAHPTFSFQEPGPQVDICVRMNYKICNPNFQDENDAVIAYVHATYKRTFALVGQRKTVALGQGSVSLTLSRFLPCER